jgi:hypothetical protein
MIEHVKNLRDVIKEAERFLQSHLNAVDSLLSSPTSSSSTRTFMDYELGPEQCMLLF